MPVGFQDKRQIIKERLHLNNLSFNVNPYPFTLIPSFELGFYSLYLKINLSLFV